jgi:DedD protein
MGLLSIFKRQADAPKKAAGASAGDPSDAVQRARTRARQRLIGAIVLLGVGIIGFPLVFETQPRPIPVNIPIEVPPKEGAPALTMPAARAPVSAAPAVASAPAVPVKPEAAVPAEPTTEAREEAGRELAASSAAPAPAPAAAPPAPKPAAVVAPPPKPVAESKPAAAVADGARAQALLEGKRDKAADAGRFVVQVGAFADAAAAHETRLKAEKLGMKTYTQVAATSAGNRIRVRLGPFTSRADADKALAKARGAGLTAVVLTL